jgi:hypothetical protein
MSPIMVRSPLKLRISLLLFLSLWFAWASANTPGLLKAWWHLDDLYRTWDLQKSLHRGLVNGRPVEGLWFYTFYLDQPPGHSTANILLRCMQSGLHCLAALLWIRLLARRVVIWKAALSALPFLLWPFNGEAVLWRTAAAYPLAVCFSLFGLLIIDEARAPMAQICGAALIGLAMLTNQNSATAGLVGFALIMAIDLDADRFRPWRKNLLRFSILCAGYLVGTAISWLITHHYAKAGSRAQFPHNFKEKLGHWRELNHLFLFWPGIYPRTLRWAHCLVLASAPIVILYRAMTRKIRISRAILVTLLLGSLLILPYTAILGVAELTLAHRLWYVAPSIIGACWLVPAAQWPLKSLPFAAAAICLGVVSISYGKMARENAREYIESYEADLRSLRALETVAAREAP